MAYPSGFSKKLTDVRSTVIEHHIGFPRLQFAAERFPALLSGDVVGEADHIGDRFDWHQIHSDDQG